MQSYPDILDLKMSLELTGINLRSAATHFKTGFLFHWGILVICPITVLKLAITVFTSTPFQTLWPNWLNFFQSFKKKNSVCDQKQT